VMFCTEASVRPPHQVSSRQGIKRSHDGQLKRVVIELFDEFPVTPLTRVFAPSRTRAQACRLIPADDPRSSRSEPSTKVSAKGHIRRSSRLIVLASCVTLSPLMRGSPDARGRQRVRGTGCKAVGPGTWMASRATSTSRRPSAGGRPRACSALRIRYWTVFCSISSCAGAQTALTRLTYAQGYPS
jgi:hypothetical protein